MFVARDGVGSLNFLLGVYECCGSLNLILRFGSGDAVRDRWVDGVLFFYLRFLFLLYAYYMLSWMKSEGNGCGKYLINITAFGYHFVLFHS